MYRNAVRILPLGTQAHLGLPTLPRTINASQTTTIQNSRVFGEKKTNSGLGSKNLVERVPFCWSRKNVARLRNTRTHELTARTVRTHAPMDGTHGDDGEQPARRQYGSGISSSTTSSSSSCLPPVDRNVRRPSRAYAVVERFSPENARLSDDRFTSRGRVDRNVRRECTPPSHRRRRGRTLFAGELSDDGLSRRPRQRFLQAVFVTPIPFGGRASWRRRATTSYCSARCRRSHAWRQS